jgi:hypothetical protein
LLIESLDELVDGTKGAAFPLIRADLHLSYTQIGLLIAVPLLVGGLIELPLGREGPGKRDNTDASSDTRTHQHAEDDDAEDGDSERTTLREALAAIRNGEVARWLILLEVTDLLLDVLTGYIGIYLVDVVHVSPADAALGVAVRLGGGLAGDALFVIVSRRVSGKAVLTVSAATAAVLYPAFLLTPWFGAKLAVLALLSVVTACWCPVVHAWP